MHSAMSLSSTCVWIPGRQHREGRCDHINECVSASLSIRRLTHKQQNLSILQNMDDTGSERYTSVVWNGVLCGNCSRSAVVHQLARLFMTPGAIWMNEQAHLK